MSCCFMKSHPTYSYHYYSLRTRIKHGWQGWTDLKVSACKGVSPYSRIEWLALALMGENRPSSLHHHHQAGNKSFSWLWHALFPGKVSGQVEPSGSLGLDRPTDNPALPRPGPRGYSSHVGLRQTTIATSIPTQHRGGSLGEKGCS